MDVLKFEVMKHVDKLLITDKRKILSFLMSQNAVAIHEANDGVRINLDRLGDDCIIDLHRMVMRLHRDIKPVHRID